MRAARLISNKFFLLFSIATLVASSLSAQTLTKKQQDSLYLLNPTQERIRKIKKSFRKDLYQFCR
jgi:hypothetical protein